MLLISTVDAAVDSRVWRRMRLYAQTVECCDPRGYEKVFGVGFARHVSRRYRKRGLDRTARRMVAFLEERGIDGYSILEVGGGVGESRSSCSATVRRMPPTSSTARHTTPRRPS